MSDYRNVPITFNNMGLNLNAPPERMEEFQWRRLDNIRVLTEGVMEARPHTNEFFSSAHFSRKVWTPTGTSLYVGYPSSFDLGDLVYVAYVGPLASGEDGILTIHKNTAAGGTWPAEQPGHAWGSSFSCFLNGIPILEYQYRRNTDTYSRDGINYTASPHPPLVTSATVPSVVRILSPTGPMVVIIDGRWKIVPSKISLTDNTTLLSFTARFTSYTNAALTAGAAVGDYTIYYVPAYRLGVRREPYRDELTTGVTVTTTTGGGLSGNYQYVVTYKNKATGARSPASEVSTTVSCSDENSGGAQLTIFNAIDPQVDQIELWRKGGDIGDSWRLVTTLTDSGSGSYNAYATVWTTYSGSTQVYTDTLADSTIALNEALDITLTHPFPATNSLGTSITLLDTQTAGTGFFYTGTIPVTCFGPFIGKYVFWLGDPVKRSAFYWNKEGEVDLSTADLSYNVVTDPGEELVNGFIYGGNPFIFTKRKLYALDYGGPEATPAFVPREVPIGLGLSAKNGLVSTKMGVFFVNHQGVYVTDCDGSPATLISEGLNPLFRGETVGNYNPINWDYATDIRLCATSRELFFFYYSSSGWETLVYDFAGQRWSRWTGQFRYAYELENSTAYRVVLGKGDTSAASYTDDSIRETGTEAISLCYARTGSWDSGVPLTDKEFGVLMLDFDPDGAEIVITPRYNSDSVILTPLSTDTSGDTNGRRVKTFQLFNRSAFTGFPTNPETFYRSISLEFSWQDTASAHPKIYQANLLFRVDEEGIVSWEIPMTSLGEGGWFHIKESYWALKSNAAVNLRVWTDGQYDDYTLASTSNRRSKIYVEHRPRRGKLHGFHLTSSSPFYFYGEDSQLFAKPWKTSTGYKPYSPFASAGYAQYLRKEGGT